MGKNDLKWAAKHSQNVAEMFKNKKPSSAITSTVSVVSPSLATASTIFVAAPSSATTSATSKKQRFDNVPELSDVPHQPKKKFPSCEFGNNEMFFPERLVCLCW